MPFEYLISFVHVDPKVINILLSKNSRGLNRQQLWLRWPKMDALEHFFTMFVFSDVKN